MGPTYPYVPPSFYLILHKGFFSVVLKAVMDHNRHFTNINTGWSGWVHTTHIFRNSRVSEMLEQGQFAPSTSTMDVGGLCERLNQGLGQELEGWSPAFGAGCVGKQSHGVLHWMFVMASWEGEMEHGPLGGLGL